MPDRLTEIAARVEAATPGPWEWLHVDESMQILGTEGRQDTTGHVLAVTPCKACQERRGCCLGPSEADAEFLKKCRSDIPFLLARIAALEETNAQLSEWRDNVSAAIRLIPEFNAGEWCGDKSGWGYHYEVVRWLNRSSRESRRRLEEFAKSGIRCDTNPTVKMSDAEAVYRTCTELLRHADEYVRTAARAALAR